MRKILKIAAVYIGFVIGAGFASGREVMEYFNLRSSTNISGVLIAAFLFMLTAYLIGAKASAEKLPDFNSYIGSVAGRAAPCVRYFMLLYMFCGLFVMFAGSGALVYSITPYSSLLGAAAMALICFIVLSFDLSGIVTVNLILVPLMIIGILGTAAYAAICGDINVFSPMDGGLGIALPAVCYASYNTLTAGAVIVPLTYRESLKTVRRSAVIGGFVIGLLIMVVWMVQGVAFDILWDSELPMLELASLCGKHIGRIYSAVLFMAICTTAISCGFGIMSAFSHKIKRSRDRVMLAAVICLAALPPALYGFSNLVAHLYFLFGAVGIIWLTWIIADWLR